MEKHPDFRVAVGAARDEARRDALEGIKAAGREDWRATAKWLYLTFPEYRENGSRLEVKTQNNVILCDEETRRQIQELRQKLLGSRGSNYLTNSDPEPNDHLSDIDAEFQKEELDL
jgi:hypothetical protein